MSLFRDPRVGAIVAAGGQQQFGNRSVYVPMPFGFCGGVRHALQCLQRAAQAAPAGRRLLLGEIIHNPSVNRHFEQLGVQIVPEPSWAEAIDSASAADTVIIPAFGVPVALNSLLDAAERRGVKRVDTTCGYVKRIWAFVDQMAAAGQSIIIHGKTGHQETVATVSRALIHRVAVVIVHDLVAAQQCAAAIAAHRPPPTTTAGLTVLNGDAWQAANCALTCQTTMLHTETVAIANLLTAALAGAGGRLQFCDTVCLATQQRQDAARALCQQGLDLVLTLGGFASSNTTQLYSLARTYAPTYFIGDASALTMTTIDHFRPELNQHVRTRDWLSPQVRRIGILAGASCPQRDIGALLQWFQNEQPQDEQPQAESRWSTA